MKPSGPTHRNWGATWETTAPGGIGINSLWVVGAYSKNIGDGHGYYGQFFWNQGTTGHTDVTSNYGNLGCCRATFNSRHIGWSFACQRPRCSDYAYLQVGEVFLTATENQAPTVIAQGSGSLWYQHGWLRGGWPIVFSATDPSGVCSAAAALGGQVLQGQPVTQYRGNWQQCPNQTFSRSIDTNTAAGSGGLGEGDMSLVLWAKNAAGVVASHQTTVHVDNQAPTASLNGPTTAPTTAGTQFITATSSAGPSGIAGIECTVDGGRGTWYPASTAAVPVSGFGVHHVTCVSYNNARDGGGSQGASAPASWTIAIRQPSISTVSFTRMLGRAHCARIRQRIRIPSQLVTVVIRGRPVRVKVPAQTRVVKRVRCRPRTAIRRVRVNGRWVRRRVVVAPRALRSEYKRIRFGAGTAISGWLGSPASGPLGGERVEILTAPDNGSYAFTQAAAVTTAADGSWSARLPAGPSRVVKAAFSGNTAVEPSQSTLAKLAVPSSLTMSISPHRTHWGGTIAISGQLRGGWVPPAGELVVLRVGWRGGSTEIGHLYAKPDGTFRSTYTFLRGNGTERYRLWAATASESDYPYAPHRSRFTRVTVGP